VDQCSDKSIDGTWYGWEWSMHVCCCAWIRIRGVGGKEHTCVSMSNGADILFVCSFCVQAFWTLALQLQFARRTPLCVIARLGIGIFLSVLISDVLG
jgi:hypothetical protein